MKPALFNEIVFMIKKTGLDDQKPVKTEQLNCKDPL
jgi:hypothetical protein